MTLACRLLVLGCVLAGLLATPAGAATVRMDRLVERDEGETYYFGEVILTASPGERNALELGYSPGADGGTVTLTDAGAPLTPGARCAAVDAHTVTCHSPKLPIVSARADLGDGDDRGTTIGEEQRLGYISITGGPGADELSGSWAALEGGDGNDRLVGRSGSETLGGGDGDDRLEGQDGNDYLDGGPGDDELVGGEGADSLYAGGSAGEPATSGRDLLDGGPGGDTLSDEDGLAPGSVGPDVLIGGPGADFLSSYIGRKAPVTVDLERRDGQGEAGENDVLEGFEWLYGGDRDDVLRGDDGANHFDGGRGEDVIDGRGGDDRVTSVPNPAEDRANAVARRYGPDRIDLGDGDDAVETLATMQSEVACGPGADRVTLTGFATAEDPAYSSLGPLLDDGCERLSMSGASKRRAVELDPNPSRAGRAALAFAVRRGRCCIHRLQVKDPRHPKRPLGVAPLRKGTTRVTVGRDVLRRSRERAITLRGKVTDVAKNRFVWRFELG